MYNRSLVHLIKERIKEPRRFMQVVVGPRQVGKTTVVSSALADVEMPVHFVSCDDPDLHDRTWLRQQWDVARQRARVGGECVLAIDEVQKIPQWSESVKSFWDEDTRLGNTVKVVLLGSSSLLIHQGLTESLTGRFELIRARHWSYVEMKDAFGWDVDTFMLFGGYPGAAMLIADVNRWRAYVNQSLVDTTVSKDILQMARVDKPALLRQLFHIGCVHSGQILSYQKMTGQLQDAGNTTTLAHYLELLEHAGLLSGLQKFSGSMVRQRSSSPKLQVQNTALLIAQLQHSPVVLCNDPVQWGRIVESAIGAHLWNGVADTEMGLYYWRERNLEVDFVLQRGEEIVAIEVKSGKRRESLPGMAAFCSHYQVHRQLLVGLEGLSIEEFLSMPVEQLFY